MKRDKKVKKLQLNAETILQLVERNELKDVNGGAASASCNTTCNFPPSCACPEAL